MAQATKQEETTSKSPFKTLPKSNYIYANGKRKSAVARVRLYEKGEGNIMINGKEAKEFVNESINISKIKHPLAIANMAKKFDVYAVVTGGGHAAQAEAIRHGIAKALIVHDPTLKVTLKKEGLLTRDPRSKERKKFGLKKARRSPQWAKR